MTEEPKPLTEKQLKRLEMQSGVTGLSSVDAHRLVAEVRRLRQLVRDVYVAIDERDPDWPPGIVARLKAEVGR